VFGCVIFDFAGLSCVMLGLKILQVWVWRGRCSLGRVVTVQFYRSSQTFRSKALSSDSESKCKPSEKPMKSKRQPEPVCWSLSWFTLPSWRRRRCIHPKRRWTSIELHGVIAHTTVHFSFYVGFVYVLLGFGSMDEVGEVTVAIYWNVLLTFKQRNFLSVMGPFVWLGVWPGPN
jgi:hypothetical protein